MIRKGLRDIFWFVSIFICLNCNAMWPFESTKVSIDSEHRTSYDQNAQTVQNVVSGEKTTTPNMTFAGQSNSVNVEISGNPNYKTSTSITTDSKNKVDKTSELTDDKTVKLPISVAITLFAIGLLLLIYAIKVARASSPSVDAAISLADSSFSRLIHGLESHQATETDSQKLLLLSTIKAQVEKERGKVSTIDINSI